MTNYTGAPISVLVASGTAGIALAATAGYIYSKYRAEALDFAKSLGYDVVTEGADEDRGLGAIRHAYTAAAMAQDGYPPDLVKMLGDANERKRDFYEFPPDPLDRNRDLWNNNRGIQNGIETKTSKRRAQ